MTIEETFRALYEAFGDVRDADAALALFAEDDDVYFAGSEVGEVARGRTELEAMLRWLATLDETLRFVWTEIDVRSEGDVAWVAADGTLNGGPYRALGVLVRRGELWRWHTHHGSEPR
jgi:ketosteroid isomerase-like protein